MLICVFRSCRDALGNVEVMQLDFEMENFTSLSVTRRINWNIDYKGQSPQSDSEKVVTELTVVQRDIQAVIPLAMVSGKQQSSPSQDQNKTVTPKKPPEHRRGSLNIPVVVRRDGRTHAETRRLKV